MKRIMAILLAAVIFASFAACGGPADTTSIAGEPEPGKALPADAELNIVVGSHASWPYSEDMKVWQYIREGVGGKLNITAIPMSDFQTKFTLMMSSQNLIPDVFGFNTPPGNVVSFAEQGAFLSYDDNLDKMPNYKAFWESVSDEEKANTIDTRRFGGEKVYVAPVYGMDRQTNIMAWLYRKDIFDKHGLEAPETMDELYEVCKTLKKLYPTSFPFAMRGGLSRLNLISASWKPGFYYGVYYDYDNETWNYGAREDTMFEILTFINKMVSEKLMPSDFVTINATSWQELITTDRGFITPDYQTRIDFFNAIARGSNPAFNLTAMVPPKANSATGAHLVNRSNIDNTGFAVCNTGKDASIINAFRYVDWFYSDEGCEAVSWGREGETYEVVDGKRKFIIPDSSKTIKTLYGIGTTGTYLRVDPASADVVVSPEQAATTDMILENTTDYMNPAMFMKFSSADSETVSDLTTSISTFVEEALVKFATGQKPLTEWDSFVKELNELPVDELISIYEENYNKLKAH